MKLKQILSDIKEEFVTGFEDNYTDKYVELFRNPTRQEIEEIVDEEGNLRFYTDKMLDNFYVWDGRVIHSVVASEIGVSLKVMQNELAGKGVWNGRSIEIESIYDINANDRVRICKDILRGEYDFLEDHLVDLEGLKRIAKSFLD